MNWFRRLRRRRPRFPEPDLEEFRQAVLDVAQRRDITDGKQVAITFRRLILDDPVRGRIVLFMLLHWCGEYDEPPETNDELQRWAGKREIASRIKAAMYGSLFDPEDEEGDNERDR